VHRLRVGAGSPHLPRGRQGEARDAGQPVEAARRGGRRAGGDAEGPDAGARPASEFSIVRFAAATGTWPAVRRDGRAQLDLPHAAGPGGSASGSGAGADRLAGDPARPRNCPRWPGGPTPPWGWIWAWAGASTDEVYAAMDWLAGRQQAIEKKTRGQNTLGRR